MIKRITSLLNTKYSIILAFVPIINIAYLLFRLFFVKIKVGRIPLWYFAIIAIPAIIFYNILPGSWGWCVTHFIISAVTAFYMYKSRGCYSGNIGFKVNVFWILLVVFILTVTANFLYTMRPAYSMGLHQEKLYEAVYALTGNNEDAWLEHIHPVHGENVVDINAVRKRFSIKIAALEGGFEHLTNRGTSFFSHEVKEGRAAGARVYVKSKGTGNRYLISAVWQDCEHGSGIITFDIMLD